MSVYMISGAVMTILIGKFSDVFGARKMLVLMMVLYTIATALAGLSQDIYTLLVIRAIQGIAIANTPIALKIIRDQFPKGKFSVGQSIVTSAYSAGMALGVVLGPIMGSSHRLANHFLHLCSNCRNTIVLMLARSSNR